MPSAFAEFKGILSHSVRQLYPATMWESGLAAAAVGTCTEPEGDRGAAVRALVAGGPPVPFVTFPHGESNWSNTLSLLLPEEIF